MFPVYNTLRKVSFCCLFVVCTLLIASAQCSFAATQDFSYTDIEVREIPAPDNFENAVRYRVTYWYKEDGARVQVFPTLEERERDADIIMAQVVRKFLDEQYDDKGKGMDEHVFSAAHMGEIIDLVSNDYLSAAWHEDNVNNLRQFISKNKKNILLFTLNIYLDYAFKGGYFSGNDINPVIAHFKDDNRTPDEITFIIVNYTDK